MTFASIKKAVMDYCLLSSPEAEIRVGQAVNRHYRRITSTLGLDAARFVTRTQTTTDGVQTVTFTEIEKIDRILDTTADTRLLTETSIHEIRSVTAGTGDPSMWALQNTDADSVTVRLDVLPQSTYTLQADGWTTLSDLTGSAEPVFPESFHDILVWAVISEELLKKEKLQLAQVYERKAESLLGDLRFHLADSPVRDTQQASSLLAASMGTAGTGGGTSGTTAYTQSALLTFDRGAGIAPFAVAQSDAPYVANLGAEFLGNVTSDRLIGRDTAGTGESEQLTVGNGLEFTGAGGIGVANDGVTYARMQNVSATSRILGRKTSGAGDPEECTLSETLDFIGSAAQGDILYRGASAWARLGAGTSGYVLKTNGAAANPAWASISTVLPTQSTPRGRLTLTSGTPVTTADVSAATTLYYTPYLGNTIALYDGSSTWTDTTFTELSITLAGLTASTPYDVWVYSNAGTATLELLAWTNATTRATALTTQNGIYVKSGATTRRYVGTIYINATGGQTDDTAAKRYVWNAYNRVATPMRVFEATNSWTYNSTTWRQGNNSTANQLDLVTGLAEEPIECRVIVNTFDSTGQAARYVSIGEDSATTPATETFRVGSLPSLTDAGTNTNYTDIMIAELVKVPAVGRHYYTWLEGASAAATFLGDNGGTLLQSGMTGVWRR